MTVLGRSFLSREMQALTIGEGWPALPQMEIVILSEGTQTSEFVRPPVDFLTDNLVVFGDRATDCTARDASFLHN
ncbi:hypothetical protein OIU35_18530 [Boseaceae bacterium BT-24-1]|nr:hypothetical protein [Boseaceae bacterium BT-24-1]